MDPKTFCDLFTFEKKTETDSGLNFKGCVLLKPLDEHKAGKPFHRIEFFLKEWVLIIHEKHYYQINE